MAEQQQSEPQGTTARVTEMSEADKVIKYCLENHVNKDVIDEVLDRGFTSLTAFKLMDLTDLQSPKIPKGQRRLLIHISRALTQQTTGAATATEVTDETTVPTAPTGTTANSTTLPTQQPAALYDQTLLNSLLSQQQQLTQATATSPTPDTADASITGQNTTLPNWNDPQIHIASATGKSAGPYYDICDFVPSTTEEEVLIGGNGEQSIILKAGPKKPLLENLTLSQWSIANLAILYKLLGEGKLQGPMLIDYLSHTTKIYQFVQRYSLPSVFLYDRECRKLQSTMGFRWGTDVPHLHKLHLLPREKLNAAPSGGGKKPQSANPNTGSKPKPDKREVSICRNYNSKKGCTFPSCRFKHQCILPGCSQSHSATVHMTEKN